MAVHDVSFSPAVVDCGNPEAVLNGNFKFVSDTKNNKYRSVVQYTCNEPYYSFDKNHASMDHTSSVSQPHIAPLCPWANVQPGHVSRLCPTVPNTLADFNACLK